MMKEYEFNPLHIWLGGIGFIFLCRYILEFLYNIFNNPIFAIVMIIILVKISSIWYSELKKWVKVN